MKDEQTVSINGRLYDRKTGLPLSKKAAPSNKNFSDFKISSKIKKKNIAPNKLSVNPKPAAVTKARNMDIIRSKAISHFAPNNKIKPSPKAKEQKLVDIGPIRHPIAATAHKLHSELTRSKQQVLAPKTAKEIKEAAIAEAMNKPATKPQKPKNTKRQILMAAFALGIILVFTGGYLAYRYLPSLSVSIASAQAGINAKYPDYKPDGYSLNGPVTYNDNEVVIDFKSNTNKSGFTIKQVKSSWDSSALREKVQADSMGNFNTTSINGLTIYSYDRTSMWVNSGILFTINGDADLLNSQIQKIATSL